MAKKNPTGGEQHVPLDLPARYIAFLRQTLTSCLEGAREDLKIPEGMPNPEKALREAAAYERLLAGIGRGEVIVPDEEAREAIEVMAAASDDASNHAEIALYHDALHGLLALLTVEDEDREVGERFAANLVRCRETVGLNEGELASRAALPEAEIERMERGEVDPYISTAIKLAGALAIPVGDLIPDPSEDSEPGDTVEGEGQ